MTEVSTADLHWAARSDSSTGVLVLAGSSGRLDTGRANAIAAAGATALAVRWFGGIGQPVVPSEVALETFVRALDLLAPECDRLAVMGTSYGAEAALLTAVRDARIDAVVALAPTDVVQEGHRDSDDDPPRSKWTWRGQPVPFIPLDRSWRPDGEHLAFTPLYEQSRDRAGELTVDSARIPVEEFRGDLLLVAGGDDCVWPSVPSARAISARRAVHGLETVVVEDAKAGHMISLPGESLRGSSRPYRVGGDEGAPERLGNRAWQAIRDILRLT